MKFTQICRVQKAVVLRYIVLCLLCRSLLKQFTTQELIRWEQLCADNEKELREGTATSPATGVFSPSTEDGQKNWTELSKRVVEHVSIA